MMQIYPLSAGGQKSTVGITGLKSGHSRAALPLAALGESCSCLAQLLVAAAALGSWPLLHLQCRCAAFSVCLLPAASVTWPPLSENTHHWIEGHLYNLEEFPLPQIQLHLCSIPAL